MKQIYLGLPVILIAVILAGCTSSSNEHVFLKTADNVRIAGIYYNSGSDVGILLLHMLGSDKYSYNGFIPKLKNYKILAIDFRGHGESDLNWRDFNEKDFNNMVYDADAGVRFLKEKGVKKVYIIGASIGANIALKYASRHEISKIVLLSPGLNFRGISIKDDAPIFGGHALMFASTGDTYSADTVRESSSIIKRNIFYLINGTSHGTNMLSDSYVADKIVEWLKG